MKKKKKRKNKFASLKNQLNNENATAGFIELYHDESCCVQRQ